MMDAHTPGPWTVYRSSDKSEHVIEARPDAWNGRRYLGQVIAHYTTDPSSAANLRLIAAAPGLLAAARSVVSSWESGDLAAAVREMSAAIAKVEA